MSSWSRLGLALSFLLASGAAAAFAQAPPGPAQPPVPPQAEPTPPAEPPPAPPAEPAQAAPTPPPAEPAATGPVYVVTYLEVDPVSVGKSVAIVHRYAVQTLRAAGNTGFIALRERDRPGRLATLESWRDKAALDAHAAAAKALVDQLQPFLVGPVDNRPSSPLDVGPAAAEAGPAVKNLIYVLTHVDVVPSGKDATIALVKTLAAASRKQDGNIRFDVLQQDSRPNHMTLVEAWRDRAARETYVTAGATKDFRAMLGPLAGALYDERLYEAIR